MNRSHFHICLLLVLLTLAVYWPAVGFEFLNYDDNLYVTQNTQVKAGLTWVGVGWAFTSMHAANWHPLTWLSHMADVQLYGLAPGGHHLTSILLHVANAVLLFLLLSRTTKALWPSAFAAALFALHPLRVESVAWVAERKDVLSTFFALLTLLAYARYAMRATIGSYLLAFAFFALGLLAKPMLVTLPFVMLLLDYWPLNRWSAGRARLLCEKLPFFALTAISCIITYQAQHSGMTVAPIQAWPLLSRLENAVMAYVRYLGKFCCPVDLAVFYPLPPLLSGWEVGLAAAVLATVSAGVLWAARRHPYLVTGWFWFLGTLVPVIGLVQVGMQAMADRYTYLPLVGVTIMLAWGGSALTARLAWRRPLLIGVATTALAVSTFLTWQQLHHWRSSYTLFSHAIAVTANNFIAQGYLGVALHMQKRYREAVQYYTLSLSVNQRQADMHHNLGLALADLGDYAEAARHFQEALLLQPHLVDTRYELALYYAELGRLADAVHHLELVVRAEPAFAKGHYTLGVVRGRQGEWAKAAEHFAAALRLNPGDPAARQGLADCRAALSRQH